MSLIAARNFIAPFTNRRHAIFIAVGILMFLLLREVTHVTGATRAIPQRPAVRSQLPAEREEAPAPKMLDPRDEIRRLADKGARSSDGGGAEAAGDEDYLKDLFGAKQEAAPKEEKQGRKDLDDIEAQLGLR